MEPQSNWAAGRLTIKFTGGDTKTVEGFSYGTLFVHRGVRKAFGVVDSSKFFDVTHMPSGASCSVLFKAERDARRFAEYLLDNFPSFAEETTKKHVVGPQPKWVRHWVSYCNLNNKWLDPTSFIAEGKKDIDP